MCALLGGALLLSRLTDGEVSPSAVKLEVLLLDPRADLLDTESKPPLPDERLAGVRIERTGDGEKNQLDRSTRGIDSCTIVASYPDQIAGHGERVRQQSHPGVP